MRYLVRERLFTITDDFWVTDERGDKVFLVDGKALRLRETFELKDASGAVRYLIQLGLVHKERVPGSRRDYYRMTGTMWDDLIRMRDQVMGRWTALVREGIDLVGAGTPAGIRMAEQAAFLEFATKELSQILGRWQEYRASGAASPG